MTAFIFLSFHAAINWANGEDDHVVAKAEYDFTAASEEEVSMQAGDMLNLAPKGETTIQPALNNFLSRPGTVHTYLSFIAIFVLFVQ